MKLLPGAAASARLVLPWGHPLEIWTMPAPPTDSSPFIGRYFNCCNVYQRIYLNKARTAFAGHCPKCARPARVKATAGGEKARFWTAG